MIATDDGNDERNPQLTKHYLHYLHYSCVSLTRLRVRCTALYDKGITSPEVIHTLLRKTP